MKDEMGGPHSTHGNDEKRIQNFGLKTPSVKSKSKDLDVEVRIILQWILVKYGANLGTGFIWLRTGTSGGLL
jgi:hypothetical protein